MSKEMQDVYTREELIEAYKVFGVPKECVVAALRNTERATKDETSKLIKDFMKKEVR